MGSQKPPVLDPEATVRKVAAMALGRAAAHRERLAAQTALLEWLADMPLEELSRHVNGRQWMAAVFAASGSTNLKSPGRSASAAVPSPPTGC